MNIPRTKAARHNAIRELIETQNISSQADLQQALMSQGISVTQATLSRDLLELRATKIRNASGEQVYSLSVGNDAISPALHLSRWCQEVLTGVDQALNQVVLHTPPGASNLLASAIDKGNLPQVIGTIAGDDTILLICKDIDSAEHIAQWLLGLFNK